MTEKMYFLSEDDRRVIATYIHREMQRRFNPQASKSTPEFAYMTPEVYMAWSSGAIPAITSATVGTGTGSVYTPNSADCDIYKIDTDTGQLTKVDTLTRTVYNLATTDIPRGWIVIQRDKFGKWVAGLGTSTSSSSGGSSGSAISDCDCYNCVPPSQAVIDTCDSCPDGALYQYHADFGTWPGLTASLGGDQYFTYVSLCLWQGPLIFVHGNNFGTGSPDLGTGTPGGGGYYQWSYNSDGADSTLVIAFAGIGNDVAGIGV